MEREIQCLEASDVSLAVCIPVFR